MDVGRQDIEMNDTDFQDAASFLRIAICRRVFFTIIGVKQESIIWLALDYFSSISRACVGTSTFPLVESSSLSRHLVSRQGAHNTYKVASEHSALDKGQ